MSKLQIKSKYGIVPNEVLNNPEMSLKAKGLFCFLQSKPNNWKFSVQRMSKQLKEGQDSIRAAIKQLESLGYLKRTAIKKNGRYNGYDYELTEFPSSENPTTENSLLENPESFSNKDYSNKDIVINNNTPETSSGNNTSNSLLFNNKDIVKILSMFKKINPSLGYEKPAQRNAIKFLLEKYGIKKTTELIQYTLFIQNKQFAPVITTPLMLKNNLGKIIVYSKRNNGIDLDEDTTLEDQIKEISSKCDKCDKGFVTKVINGYTKSVPCQCIEHLLTK